MDNTEDDYELKLIKASAGLLDDLEQSLPKLLWKNTQGSRKCHSLVKKRDFDHVTSLIEPFQGDPQLLDSRLKSLVPQIVDAYLQHPPKLRKHGDQYIGFEAAVCSLLYTFSKIRGYKVIVGFLNNEPRYLIRIVQALEHASEQQSTRWQVPYVLLLWLSHLLLTPFDLISISTESASTGTIDFLQQLDIPPLMLRILHLGLKYLPTPTKAQDAASNMLVRLVTRPDVQRLKIADVLVKEQLRNIQRGDSINQSNAYETLGSLRLLSKVVTSPELSHLIPDIYRVCQKYWEVGYDNSVTANAVAKKIMIKIFRNITILSLRAASVDGPLRSFLETTDVLEDVIDHLLRSLADKDTPVRYAAAKAISLIILELESGMGYEVIQAILDTFKEDIPRSASSIDFSSADPLKWHGLALALSHTIFTRSASPEQMPDILVALLSASQFQQRTATGTELGTNVRDAANFGIWSLARRYTTSELLAVPSAGLVTLAQNDEQSVIQILAIQLLLSACLDPAGNIRRGSSAALQELIGRHPDQVVEGIALVQVVDYQAVGLRQRAMNEVANRAAVLNVTYWRALLEGLLSWRGLGSSDVAARESAAQSISRLVMESGTSHEIDVLQRIVSLLQQCSTREMEDLHGLTLAAASIVNLQIYHNESAKQIVSSDERLQQLWSIGEKLHSVLKDFSSVMMRAELPASISRYVAAVCNLALSTSVNRNSPQLPWTPFDSIVKLLLVRHEDWILSTIPPLVKSQVTLKRHLGVELTGIGCQHLMNKVKIDCSKSTLYGAGRALALGTLTPLYNVSTGLEAEEAETAIEGIASMINAPNIDWRVIGLRTFLLAIEYAHPQGRISEQSATTMCQALSIGFRDYTIDERGDVGSLVRLQAILCTSKVLTTKAFSSHGQMLESLKAGIYRLSLEKLDRVRVQAAQCRCEHLGLAMSVKDVAGASSLGYLMAALEPIASDSPAWVKQAIVEGSISCSGSGSESLIQVSRSALVSHLWNLENSRLLEFMDILAAILKEQHSQPGASTKATLDFLAFLLDARLIQRVRGFKWRNLLSSVQKSHYKSNDVPRILAAVNVYTGLAEITAVRGEVFKKLVGMLKSNPFPRVRVAIAEALWLTTKDVGLCSRDWAKPVVGQEEAIAHLYTQYVVANI